MPVLIRERHERTGPLTHRPLTGEGKERRKGAQGLMPPMNPAFAQEKKEGKVLRV